MYIYIYIYIYEQAIWTSNLTLYPIYIYIYISWTSMRNWQSIKIQSKFNVIVANDHGSNLNDISARRQIRDSTRDHHLLPIHQSATAHPHDDGSGDRHTYTACMRATPHIPLPAKSRVAHAAYPQKKTALQLNSDYWHAHTYSLQQTKSAWAVRTIGCCPASMLYSTGKRMGGGSMSARRTHWRNTWHTTQTNSHPRSSTQQ